MLVYGTFQRPVRRFLPGLRSLCGEGFMGTVACPSFEGTMHALRLTVPQPWLPVGAVFHRAGRTGAKPLRRRPTPNPIPLCAAQARPPSLSGDTKGPARRPAVSPGSPGGDHFPRTRCVRFRVLPSRPAPTPPRCNALQGIRGGMGNCRHGFWGRGKWRGDFLCGEGVPWGVDPGVGAEDDDRRKGWRPKRRSCVPRR